MRKTLKNNLLGHKVLAVVRLAHGTNLTSRIIWATNLLLEFTVW